MAPHCGRRNEQTLVDGRFGRRIRRHGAVVEMAYATALLPFGHRRRDCRPRRPPLPERSGWPAKLGRSPHARASSEGRRSRARLADASYWRCHYHGHPKASTWRGLIVPIPHLVAAFFLYATSAVVLLTVLNLALRGLGAPFAVALSRRLATDWLYSRTRNPMVLATLACLFAVGLWLQSALFLLWHLALVTPAWLFLVKVYEERELEIRFGEPYRLYRASTPFLWPSIRPHTPPN